MTERLSKVGSREVLKTLEHYLDVELGLYDAYLKALQIEGKLVRAQETEKMKVASESRERLYDAMKTAEQKRVEYVRSLSGGDSQHQKLSEFVRLTFSPLESQRLLQKIERLKALVKRCHRESGEFGQMVNFSLNMVSGLISIFWNATQCVVRSYNQNGKMRESFAPSATRTAGLLKQV